MTTAQSSAPAGGLHERRRVPAQRAEVDRDLGPAHRRARLAGEGRRKSLDDVARDHPSAPVGLRREPRRPRRPPPPRPRRPTFAPMPFDRNAATIPVRTSPRAGRREPRVAEVADEDSPARRRDERVRALEEDDRAHVVGTRLRRVEPAGRHGARVPPEQPGELAGVRRENRGRIAREDPVEVARDGPQAVGIEDDRLVEPVEEVADQGADGVRPTDPGPDRDGCRPSPPPRGWRLPRPWS